MENTTPNKPAQSAPSEPVDTPPPETRKPQSSLFVTIRQFFGFGNKYFWLFAILVVVAAVITVREISMAKKAAAPKTAASLTSQQISALKGATTLVGDSQQTLDIQGNSVFEGQVLMRGNLNVAGSIKAGGGLSLPTLDISGTANLGQAAIGGNLSVAGSTNLQGQVNIQKNLTVAGSGTFGTLSASQLNLSSLQLTGDLSLAHHLVASGGTPGRSNGTALGGGGTASVSGSDTGGTVTINTGSSPPAGCFVTINFTQKFAATPHVVISPSNSSAGGLDYYTNRSATSFSICADSVPAGGTTYLFDYFVSG